MAKAPTTTYGNDSISMLKGAERVRKRPSVIFGSDGLEGCEHAVFEILSNAIDEAREGFGNIITVTRYEDKSIEVEDFGRGCPVDWNEKEQRYNWELIFCEMYAGGKYKNNEGENYEYSRGLNGLGACATHYASEYMDVTIWRDGKKYTLHFRHGEVVGGLESAPADRKKTGTTIRWRPDLEVFTDIDVPESYFQDVLHRQADIFAQARTLARQRLEQPNQQRPDHHGHERTQRFFQFRGHLGGDRADGDAVDVVKDAQFRDLAVAHELGEQKQRHKRTHGRNRHLQQVHPNHSFQYGLVCPGSGKSCAGA